MSIRTFGIMITVWNRDATNSAYIEYMKERLQELLMTSEEVRYQDHKGTIKHNEMKRKARVGPDGVPLPQGQQPQQQQQQGKTQDGEKIKKKPKAMDVASLGGNQQAAKAEPVAPGILRCE